MNKNIPIIIPAFEPDGRLIDFLNDIGKVRGRVILVDDGSGKDYEDIFSKAKELIEPLGGVLLRHEINRGKGRALKTAFSYLLEHDPDAQGAVTADSDGQHTVDMIDKVKAAMESNPDALILGVRDFDQEGIPWKSEFGNRLTMRVLGYVSGIRVSDTQTGLRGISRAFMKVLLDVRGERFEFETRMLLETRGRCSIVEVPIKTIYDSKYDHQTHFHPIRDSIKIYKVLGEQFLIFIFASLSSCILDLLLFAAFCHLLKTRFAEEYVFFSTLFARLISAFCNYMINYKKVFQSRENMGKAALKYTALAVAVMLMSALFVTAGVRLLPVCPEIAIKMVVDTFLFFISYKIQQKLIF